ncbi:MAG: MFS transporter [Patescibacteria group bacterium]|nr:MFS transporter [Patescibacteria group bacterium]
MFKSVNKIIKVIIASDFIFNSGWAFLGPIFAIFIVQKISLGSITEAAEIAGFSSLIYWSVKSFLQIPIGSYLDKNHGEEDDFWFMVAGTFLTGLSPFGFMISSEAWHIYAFQVLHAVGMAMVVPSWGAIFTRHIDKGKEAFEWGLRSTTVGFGAGIAGATGGIMVAFFSFDIVFIAAGTFTIVSAFLLLLIRDDVIPRDKTLPHIPRFKVRFPRFRTHS